MKTTGNEPFIDWTAGERMNIGTFHTPNVKCMKFKCHLRVIFVLKIKDQTLCEYVIVPASKHLTWDLDLTVTSMSTLRGFCIGTQIFKMTHIFLTPIKGPFTSSVSVDAWKEYIGFNCTKHTKCQHRLQQNSIGFWTDPDARCGQGLMVNH